MTSSAIPSFIKVSQSDARVATSGTGDEMIRREINVTETRMGGQISNQRTSTVTTTTGGQTTTTVSSNTVPMTQYSSTSANYGGRVEVSRADTNALASEGKILTADQYIQSDTTGVQSRPSYQYQSIQPSRVSGEARTSAYETGETTTIQGGAHQGSRTRVLSQVVSGGAEGSYIHEGQREFGEQRLISRTERVDESRSHVISERIEEREILIPKRVIVEEVIERTIVIPEKVIREEVINASHTYKERIVERTKPIIVDKVIEVPEIVTVEKEVEEFEDIIQPKIIWKEVGEPEEHIIHQPKFVPKYVEKIVEITKTVEEPYEVIVDQIVEREVPYDEIVKERIPNKVIKYQDRKIPRPRTVVRKLPIPVAVEAEYEYRVPQLRPIYTKQTFPLYVPRFIEVPVPKDMLSPELQKLTETQLKQIESFPTGTPTLCEIETVAADIRKSNVQKELSAVTAQDAVKRAWNSGNLDLIKAQ